MTSSRKLSTLLSLPFLFLILTTIGCNNLSDFSGLYLKEPVILKENTNYNNDFSIQTQFSLNGLNDFNRIPDGWLDWVNETSGSGWAHDKDAGLDPIDVHIYVDGRFYTSVTANESRPDVMNAGFIPNAEHGFSFSTVGIPAGRHLIEAYAIDYGGIQNQQLQGSPKSLRMPVTDVTGYLDFVDSNGGYGWAYDQSAGTNSISVNIYLDGAFYRTVLANRIRHDLVAASVVPNAEHGFVFTLSGLSQGQYSISAYAVSNNGGQEVQLSRSPRPVTVTASSNALPVGNVEQISENGCSGWAFDNDLGANPVDVNVFIDGILYASVNADYTRDDLVLNGTLSTPNHGFTVAFTGLLPGYHDVTVYAVDNVTRNHIAIDNSNGSINIQGSSLPDLVPLDLTWTPSNPKPGQNVQFNVRIKNEGNADTGQDVLVLYEIEASSFVSYGRSGSLQSGSESYDFISLIPWNAVAEGDFTVTATIDPNFLIDELYNNNNTITKNINISNDSLNNAPTGWLDYVDENGGSGWAYDSDAGTVSVDVHIYVDNQYYTAVTANSPRDDLVSAGVAPNPEHGFTFTLSGLSSGTHEIRTYALDYGGNINSELMGSPKIITIQGNGNISNDWNDLYSDTWVATDNLGRTLPDNNECGSVNEEKFVGLFYWTWHGAIGMQGPYDIMKIQSENPSNPQYGPEYTNHHWGESEHGYYLSTDPYVLRKHASMLTDAGVDVIIFDTSNDPYTWENEYMQLCAVFTEIRDEGGATPQIAFLAPFFDAQNVIQTLYNNFYNPGLYQDLWFEWEGKPLIMADPNMISDSDQRNFFTFRKPVASYYTGSTGTNQWSWLEVYPQNPFYNASGELEQVSVGVGQNGTSNALAPMSLPSGIHGRSWHNGSYDSSPGSVDYGYNFKEQWERALQLDPKFVFITGWNEWTATRFTEWAGYRGNAVFVDQFNQEYSRDIEPMKGGHGDNYYYQMTSYIRKFKGVRSSPSISSTKTISIDGVFTEWNNVKPGFMDTKGDTEHRKWLGWSPGWLNYFNNSGRNDIVLSKIARDNDNIYFYVETLNSLSHYEDSYWMLLFIDSDQNASTGWYGYEYIANFTPQNETTTELRRTSDLGLVSTVPFRYSGNKLELSVPREDIGETGQLAIDFHWGDNIKPNYSFYFNQNANLEGWSCNSDLISCSVSGGSYKAQVSGTDPMISSESFAIDTKILKYFEISIKNETASNTAQFYWMTDKQQGFDGAKVVTFNIEPNSPLFKKYIIDLNNVNEWKDTVIQMRLDPVSFVNTGSIEIDYIKIYAEDGAIDFANSGDSAPNRGFNYRYQE